MNEIFYQKPYLQELSTSIIEIIDRDDGIGVLLNENIIYPGGGGQPPDKGEITLPDGSRNPIIRIVKQDNVPYLLLPKNILVKKEMSVQVTLDWTRRYKYMRYHTAAHLLMGLIKHRIKHYIPKGISIAEKKNHATVKFEGIWTPHQKLMEEIKDEANDLIQKDLTIKMEYYNDLESVKDQYPTIYRGPKVWTIKTDSIRVIIINELDANPCGGIHVKSLQEIGKINITSFKENEIRFTLLKE